MTENPQHRSGEDEFVPAGDDQVAERLAAMTEEEAEARAASLRAGLEDYELEEDDAALLDAWQLGPDEDVDAPVPPVLAIVGRPNVGKSTLVNRIIGRREAVVEDVPGVTRDRREGQAKLYDLDFTIIDTAGLDEGAKGSLTARMQEQTETAIELADALMFVIDARVGLTPTDRAFADFARKANKPVVLVANKAEGKHGEIGAMESYALGLGDPVQISAEHGEGMGDLHEALSALVPETPGEDDEVEDDEDISEEEAAQRPIRVAIVGRPNAGKSTLINHLLGEERLLTSPEAGTTRDSIAVEITWQGRQFRVFDTAGLRRRSRIEEKLEKLSVADALRAVRFAEVVVVLLDVAIPFEQQDLRIADFAESEGRAVVIAANKWDLEDDKPHKLNELREAFERLLPQLKGAPLVTVSARTGKGLDRLHNAILKAHEVWNRRISTARLNQWLTAMTEAHPPPAPGGRRIRLRYMTQVKTRPPGFVVMATHTDQIPESYRRYLVNGLRDSFDMPGTPIRLTLRSQSDKNPYRAKKKSTPSRLRKHVGKPIKT